MKHTKFILALATVLFSVDVNAQSPLWNVLSGSVTTSTTGDCSVGGTLYNPGGVIDLSRPTDIARTIIANSTVSSLNILSGTGATDGAQIGLHSAGDGGSMNFHVTGAGGYNFYYWNGSYFNQLMNLTNAGDLTLSNNAFIRGGVIDMTRTADVQRTIIANSAVSSLNILSGTNATDGAQIGLHSAGDGGSMNLHITGAGGYNFYHWTGSVFNQLMNLTNAGDLTVSNNAFIRGGVLDMTRTADVPRTIIANSAASSLNILSGTNATDGAQIGLHSAGDGGAINFHSMSTGGFQFYHYNGSAFDLQMDIKNDGTVMIGNVPDPTTYHYGLVVQHGILTEKLKVANSTDPANWSDFVFNNDYELMPLSKVESFVKANKHLPEIPSAKEVAADGIDVASMDAKLLQKIEELTLYVIQQQKEIEILKERVH